MRFTHFSQMLTLYYRCMQNKMCVCKNRAEKWKIHPDNSLCLYLTNIVAKCLERTLTPALSNALRAPYQCSDFNLVGSQKGRNASNFIFYKTHLL